MLRQIKKIESNYSGKNFIFFDLSSQHVFRDLSRFHKHVYNTTGFNGERRTHDLFYRYLADIRLVFYRSTQIIVLLRMK